MTTQQNKTDRNNVLRLTRDELNKTSGILTDVNDPEEARTALERDTYISLGEDITFPIVAHAMPQAAVGIAKLPRMAVNFLRATAFLLEEI